ncbi:hypothetical protein [Sinorhizobium medicae]|uniref:hypothetical protein n=1 Tax=Sinorhizobium medicae TaxID=110321 RepID=UPI00048946C5|nr:hypothetical protein [Sinorhizobium medicae]
MEHVVVQQAPVAEKIAGQHRIAEVIAHAQRFDMSAVLSRYIQLHNVETTLAHEHERELKRFLVIASLFPQESFSMAGPTDDLWHEFILFTKEYIQFCELVGGEYIHHSPTVDDGEDDLPAGMERRLTGYQNFLSRYRSVFAEEPPPHIWPLPFDYSTMATQALCIVRCGS